MRDIHHIARAALKRFRRDKKGVSAIEFALVLPVMITIYFGTNEISDMLMVDRKAATLASTAADLVAQDTEITNSEIADVFAATEALIQPYPTGTVTIVISSVVADANGVAKVAWSDGFNAGARAVNSTVTLPAGLIAPLESVIMAETGYTYDSATAQFLTGSGYTLTDTFYLKPRRSLTVARVP